jgi:dihydrodipicolinate synthase/N-acetylneuraminate lyase
VIAGSNGEAVATTMEERLKLIALTREIAVKYDRGAMPIVIGTVGQTTNEIIQQTRQAQTAGADFALVLTPSYFHFAMSATAIQDFFTEVCTTVLYRAVPYPFATPKSQDGRIMARRKVYLRPLLTEVL